MKLMPKYEINNNNYKNKVIKAVNTKLIVKILKVIYKN